MQIIISVCKNFLYQSRHSQNKMEILKCVEVCKGFETHSILCGRYIAQIHRTLQMHLCLAQDE